MLINFILEGITIIFLFFTLIKQIKLKNMYKHNGYVNHRKAFILSTITLIFFNLLTIGMKLSDISFKTTTEMATLWAMDICLLIVSVVLCLWFHGSNFKFLSMRNIINFITK